jgi:hypothetical protein
MALFYCVDRKENSTTLEEYNKKQNFSVLQHLQRECISYKKHINSKRRRTKIKLRDYESLQGLYQTRNRQRNIDRYL